MMSTMSEKLQNARERGRPRQFDLDAVLDLAMPVFREKGYHSASISDLSDAMQLTAGSIYFTINVACSCRYSRVIPPCAINRCASVWRDNLMAGPK